MSGQVIAFRQSQRQPGEAATGAAGIVIPLPAKVRRARALVIALRPLCDGQPVKYAAIESAVPGVSLERARIAMRTLGYTRQRLRAMARGHGPAFVRKG